MLITCVGNNATCVDTQTLSCVAQCVQDLEILRTINSIDRSSDQCCQISTLNTLNLKGSVANSAGILESIVGIFGRTEYLYEALNKKVFVQTVVYKSKPD